MHVRNWITRAALVAVLASVGGAAAPQLAEARTISGTAGITVPEHRGCWWPYNGAMSNLFCGVTVSYDIPLMVDSGGYKNASVTAKGSGPSQNVGCRAEGTDFTVSNHWYSNGGAYSYLGQFGVPYEIVINGAAVPGWGQFLVNCQVSHGAQIYSAWVSPP